MPDQQIKQGMNLAIVNEVIVIQHQNNVFRHIGQIVDEQGSHAIRWWKLRCLKAGRFLKRIGKDGLQGSGERVHEDAQLVVVFIQGEPGREAIARLQPLGQQRRLTKPGKGGNQRDFAAQPGV